VTNVHEIDPTVGNDERLVTLSLTTPSSVPTRALSSTQEDAVHTVDVLLFNGEDFFYRAIGDQPNASNEFTVKLPSNASAYKAVVLANARAILTTLSIPVAQKQTPGTTRTNLLESITHILSGSVSEWTSALGTNGIPMWGYENDLAVNESSSNPAATISLTRMVAKIDITVDEDVTNFKLASVSLYNYSGRGTIAPAASTWSTSGYDPAQWNGVKAIAPHLFGGIIFNGHIDYSISPAPGITSFTNEIYVYEAQAGTNGFVGNTCLVIGGYYEGATTPTYYRVEFIGTDGTTFLPLLRNHKYSVNITEVTAHGYPSASDAYKNKPANIVVQIIPWNEGGLDDITFDPQHYLAVDKSALAFYASGGTKTMAAITDFPAGWTIEKDALYDWFTVSPLAHASTSQQTITVTITNGNGPRDGYFYIVAGNLKKKITVTQSDEEEFMLLITDTEGNPLNELTFDAGDIEEGILPAARSFQVTWFPTSENCQVERTFVPGMSTFTFNTTETGINPVSISPLTGGSETITIQPDLMAREDPDRVSRLDFIVNRDGQYRMAALYLRQINNSYVIPEPDPAGYLADGVTLNSFMVKSNIPWIAVLDGGKADEDNLMASWTPSGGPNPSGEPFQFTLHNRPGAKATVSFKGLDGITYGTAIIKSGIPYAILSEQTTLSSNYSWSYQYGGTVQTNIPITSLSATLGGTGTLVSLLDPYFIILEGHTVLRLAINPNVQAGTIQTNTVNVMYNGQVLATLTVNVASTDWQLVGSDYYHWKLVAPTTGWISVDEILEDGTICPPGSSQPRSAEEAVWYNTYIAGMEFSSNSLIDAGGIHLDRAGVIWLGAPVETVSGYRVASCVWNQEVVSGGYITLETDPLGVSCPAVSYPYGQYIGAEPAYLTAKFKCVVWD
jgi:hypothetical protein